MPLPISPDPISLADLQTNFGGTDPISLNEYYRRGARVADIPENNKVPTAGTISLENFYGAQSKITVTNNGTLVNVNMQTAFTINGINYWTRNIEKEYINNGTIGSNNATLAALTVSGGRNGTFTLTNTGSILGAGGDGARVLGIPTNTRSDAQNGGTAIQNNSSNYTLVNSGFIYGGGGGGARGRNGGDGGRGGYGRPLTGFNTVRNTINEQKCGSCYNGRGGFGTNVVVFQNGRQIYERFNAPADAVNVRRINAGSFICRVDNRTCTRVNRRTVCTGDVFETFCASARYDIVTTVLTYTLFDGCAGAVGNTTGGRGGQGQGYQRQSGPESGVTGSAATGALSCCANAGPGPVGRLAGCGGARGKGGDGSAGGTWGQSGGSQETSSATSGQTGQSGFDVQLNISTPGSLGRSPGNNPSSPGAGGFYLSGSAGNTITFTNTGTVLGRLS